MELYWDRPDYLKDGQSFLPKIYEGLSKDIPNGYNTVTIKLDGTARGDLSWKQEQAYAAELVEKGYALFWDIDLGLFNKLTMPLDNQGQFLSLALTLEHFRDTLWSLFKSKTVGVSIFRGSLDFSQSFNWDTQQVDNFKNWVATVGLLEADPNAKALFCREVCLEYLSLLTTRLPDSLPCYLFLDVSLINHVLKEIQLLNPERYDHLNLILKGASFFWNRPEWVDEGVNWPLKKINPSLAICLPQADKVRKEHLEGLSEVLEALLDLKTPFRIIAENHLITSWDGLDYLIYVPDGLSSQGKRKLQGFCAAGGTVVSVKETQGFSNEIEFLDLLELL